MRRSHQNQFHQRKSPPTRHSTQPKAVKQSVIVSNGCIERILHPNDNTMCVFRYRRDRRPVESQWLGTIPHETFQKWDLTALPWYLNVKRFLYLYTYEDSIAYMTRHCIRVRGQQSMPEFGRHLYVDSDGILCVMEIFRTFRADKHILHSDEHYINDVLPKIQIQFDLNAISQGKNYLDTACFRRLTTLSVVAEKSRIRLNYWPTRWWYKYGREIHSRFFEWESAEVFWTNGTVDDYAIKESKMHFKVWKILKVEPYYGIYVDVGAKLIVRDVLNTGPNSDYNHTLIQSGCLVVIQGKCRLTFMDNTQKVYALRDVFRKAPKHPIIVLSAVPSLGESLCWGLSITVYVTYGGEQPIVYTVDSIINVPLLGMNNNRMRVLELHQGFQEVLQKQSTFDYGQFVREDTAFPFDPQFRPPEFIADEPLEYPRV